MDRLLASTFGGFWWVLGAKLGRKIEPRAIKNRLKTDRKNKEKTMRFGSPLLGGNPCTLQGDGWILGPPNYQFLKKTTHHRPQTTRTLSHALRASAVADLHKRNHNYRHRHHHHLTFLLLVHTLHSRLEETSTRNTPYFSYDTLTS